VTNLADHLKRCSHDTINLLLKTEKITSRMLWEQVKLVIQTDEGGYLLFDDTVIDKRFAPKIELTRRQYSGNEKRVIRGIGLVTCIYVNPKKGLFWIVDYRIYDPDGDGKTKLDHVEDMLKGIVYHKQLPFWGVLMDSWYATKDLMLLIDSLGKFYYCPLKKNRLVDDTGGVEKYKRIEKLSWSDEENESGKIVKVKGFPNQKKMKLFRVVASNGDTEYVATNDISQSSTDDVKDVCANRWKIEEFHRELKQLTGVEKCQCRKARIQRNHIGCAILVWLRLKDLANQMNLTIYQLKQGLLSDYLSRELQTPTLKMTKVKFWVLYFNFLGLMSVGFKVVSSPKGLAFSIKPNAIYSVHA
jgi:hypothetical protein